MVTTSRQGPGSTCFAIPRASCFHLVNVHSLPEGIIVAFFELAIQGRDAMHMHKSRCSCDTVMYLWQYNSNFTRFNNIPMMHLTISSLPSADRTILASLSTMVSIADFTSRITALVTSVEYRKTLLFSLQIYNRLIFLMAGVNQPVSFKWFY